jgi:hypothetical protein
MNPDKAATMMENNTDALPPGDGAGGELGNSTDDFSDETPTLETEESGFFDDITGRLMATEPNPDLETIENPYDPEKGGLTRIFRGIQKMGDIDGLPAIADIIIGIIETSQDGTFEVGHENTDTQTDTQTNRQTDPQTDVDVGDLL